MKKLNKKLQLNKMTVAQLNENNLGAIKGGATNFCNSIPCEVIVYNPFPTPTTTYVGSSVQTGISIFISN